MTVKHVNLDKPSALESDERVVFGRIIFITHSDEWGELQFPPCGLGLVHMETEKRARQATFVTEPWFEDDGTFFWILNTGSYKIDALGWGFRRNLLFMSEPDPVNPKTAQIFPLKPEPEEPPECGFVISPHIGFNVSGDSCALYIGSLLIDMDIKIEHGIEVKKINRFEIMDEYTKALELLKSRYPSLILTTEKRLMTAPPYKSVPVANGLCPGWGEILLRDTLGVAVQIGLTFIHFGPTPTIGPGTFTPSFGR